jgi:hypothetical protein
LETSRADRQSLRKGVSWLLAVESVEDWKTVGVGEIAEEKIDHLLGVFEETILETEVVEVLLAIAD